MIWYCANCTSIVDLETGHDAEGKTIYVCEDCGSADHLDKIEIDDDNF